MSDKSYQIVVTGELVDGSYLPEVKRKLAALFNSPPEKLDPLFSGKRVVIKKGLGEDAARNYITVVREAGLWCVAEATAAEVVGGAPAGIGLAPAGAILVEHSPPEAPSIDTSAYTVAPRGETLVEPRSVTVPEIDVSALSMDPVGEDLVEHNPPEAPTIDTSDLSVAPPGARLAEPEEVMPRDIDISDLNLAPVGSDMGEMKRGETPPPPDTSHLKLD